MAKSPPRLPTGPTTPDDFVEVEPTELHPTNNIRFVMWEVARLTERLEALAKAFEKSAESSDRLADKQATSLKDALGLHATDIKERIAEVKVDVKEARNELREIDKKVAYVQGATRMLAAFSVIATLILGALFTALARKWIG